MLGAGGAQPEGAVFGGDEGETCGPVDAESADGVSVATEGLDTDEPVEGKNTCASALRNKSEEEEEKRLHRWATSLVEIKEVNLINFK